MSIVASIERMLENIALPAKAFITSCKISKGKKTDSKLIALRIKQAMGKKYSTKSLAENCGIGHEAMRGILSAQTMPKISTMIQIARVLDVSMDWLCGLKEE